MIENIRVSLWDVFSFFLTGLLASCLVVGFLLAYGLWPFTEFVETVAKVPTAITLVAGPLVLTLLGMVIEPLANYFDKFILHWLLAWASKSKHKHSSEELLLAEEIKSKYLGSLNGRIENPYYICKEYVETKQLSTTFMVFLSRYGFYRNCAFLSMLSGLTGLILERTWLSGIVVFLVCVFAAAIFKRRADDFFSYLAPAVYHAFLIDKLSWVPDKKA